KGRDRLAQGAPGLVIPAEVAIEPAQADQPVGQQAERHQLAGEASQQPAEDRLPLSVAVNRPVLVADLLLDLRDLQAGSGEVGFEVRIARAVADELLVVPAGLLHQFLAEGELASIAEPPAIADPG